MTFLACYFAKTRAIADVRRHLAEHPRPAVEQGKDECCRSGACCHWSPPQLTPEDVRRLAAHFGLQSRDFVARYCTLAEPGYEPENEGAGLARYGDRTGVVLDDEETWSGEPCILFDREAWGCSVHEIKPYGCASWGCWTGQRATPIAKWTADEREELLLVPPQPRANSRESEAANAI